MSVDMVCERSDGICNLCGADPHEDCPLIGLEVELSEWSELKAVDLAADAECKAFVAALNKASDDECESCQ
jgi:hypothetical protein